MKMKFPWTTKKPSSFSPAEIPPVCSVRVARNEKKHLRALQPNRFEDLVAMNALYRPGPMGIFLPSSGVNWVRAYRIRPSDDGTLSERNLWYHRIPGTGDAQSRALGLFTRGQSDTLRKAMG